MRLRTRLFLLVLLASALPAALVLTVGWLQLRRQLSLWTLPSVESALEVSVQTNRRAVDRLMRQLETEGRILAESSLFPPAPADTTGLTELLDSGCREFGLDLAQFYVAEDGGFRLLVSRTSSGPGGPDGSAWLLPPLGSVAGPERPRPVRLRGSREDHLAIPTFLWEEAPADSARLRGALLLGVAMGAGFHDQVMEVSTGLHLYRRLREMGMLLQTGFGLLAAFVLALSFAVSYWAAQRVAGSVSRPIDSLIRDMDAVGRSGDAAAGGPDATPGDGAAPGSGPPRAVGGDGAAGGSGPEPGQDRAIGGQRRGTAERRSPIPEMARLTEAFRSMRRTLQAYEESLRESERVRGAQETARFVAHEIRNTLTPVRASLSVLERQMREMPAEVRPRAERALELIRAEADRMASLAGAFSEYARFPDRRPQRFDLGPLVEEIARAEVPERIALSVERPAALPEVEADREEMERIFRNLVRNAVESFPPDGAGAVRIVFERCDPDLEVRIEDTGCGMDAETLRKALQPGYTTKPAGTGLGLALVRRSLSHHGGSIRLESRVGTGTRCRVRLPIAGQRTPAPPEPEAPRTETAPSGEAPPSPEPTKTTGP